MPNSDDVNKTKERCHATMIEMYMRLCSQFIKIHSARNARKTQTTNSHEENIRFFGMRTILLSGIFLFNTEFIAVTKHLWLVRIGLEREKAPS